MQKAERDEATKSPNSRARDSRNRRGLSPKSRKLPKRNEPFDPESADTGAIREDFLLGNANEGRSWLGWGPEGR